MKREYSFAHIVVAIIFARAWGDFGMWWGLLVFLVGYLIAEIISESRENLARA